MTNIFTKKDLKTGDIVITRDREPGIVIAENEVIIYQNSGMDFFDAFTDDLLSDDRDFPECDIMDVIRGEYAPVGFLDPYDGELVFSRKDEIGFVEKKEVKSSEEPAIEIPEENSREKSGLLKIIAQAFYGNRTFTWISPEDMDGIILGHLVGPLKVTEPIDRTIVHVPESDNVVLVYNRYQEETTLRNGEELLRDEGYEIKPLAVIPETGLKIYSRCIGLRMNKDGRIESLQQEDVGVLFKYLAQ